MTKRPAVLLCILLLLATAILGFYYGMRSSNEPAYEGKTVRAWIIACLSRSGDSDEQVCDKAEKALRHLGTNAIPPLCQLLRAETNSTFRIRCRALLEHIPFIKKPLLAREENYLAHSGFGMLGDAATNAVPELIRMCRQTNSMRLRYEACDLLRSIIPTLESTAFFRDALTNSDNYSRLIAYDYLTQTNQPEHLQLLIEALKDPSLEVQKFSSYRLQFMRGAAKPAVPFLVPLAGVITNGFRPDAYSYNPAAAALRAIDPETATKVLPPGLDEASPPPFDDIVILTNR